MQISEFQKIVERTYLERDKARGVGGTFMWFVEEVGELATELREGRNKIELEREFADVFAWLCSLASIEGISMEKAADKYAHGCPRCKHIPCDCSEKK